MVLIWLLHKCGIALGATPHLYKYSSRFVPDGLWRRENAELLHHAHLVE
jgi:hypothetical protein